jgi:hypothetical protein
MKREAQKYSAREELYEVQTFVSHWTKPYLRVTIQRIKLMREGTVNYIPPSRSTKI